MKTSAQFATPARRPFVVLGATGKTGHRVADRLERGGHRVIRAHRSGVHAFDWNDASTWDRLLEGAYGLYAAYTPDLAAPGAIAIARALGACAAKHGIERAVLLSGRGEEAARHAEDAFFESMPLADGVRCAWFDQNFTEGLMASVIAATGEVSLPGPATAFEPFIDADDIADCAVHCLTSPTRIGGVHEITGPESLSLGDTAAILSRVSGAPIVYRESSIPAFAELVGRMGVPAEAALVLAHTFHEILGRNPQITSGVAELLGRPARTFEQFARDAYAGGVNARASGAR
jgi:uncharacterized protein YbjT (DUF2867 family)